jgi:glutamine phosphoribosylpyrophosphate amidotransferase
MCGIAAWAGENPKHFNKYKFDILGIFNDSRGGDSCGVSTDGEIYYGLTTSDKKYKDFLVEKNYLVPKSIPIVIAHTRKSSVGTINMHNAHPFGFGINEKYDSFEFIGCHNGTLYNYEELAREFNVSVNDNDSNGVFKRRKIDSEVFLEIIYKNKNFKVLSKYNGGAAIVFYNTLEPNVLYAFHGESSTYSNTKPEEERPLFYYQEKSNSVYISSIAESLVAIGGELNKNVFSFKTNCVYKIKNGNVDKAELFEISRNTVFSKKPYTASSFCGYGNASSADFDESEFGQARP